MTLRDAPKISHYEPNLRLLFPKGMEVTMQGQQLIVHESYEDEVTFRLKDCEHVQKVVLENGERLSWDAYFDKYLWPDLTEDETQKVAVGVA